MKLEQFAKKTGWPIDEIDSMDLWTFADLLSLYDLTMLWNIKRASVQSIANELDVEPKVTP